MKRGRIQSDDEAEVSPSSSMHDYGAAQPSTKRGRVDEHKQRGGEPDDDGEDEVDVDIEAEEEEETRFLPPSQSVSVSPHPNSRSKRKPQTSSRSKAKSDSRSGSSRPERKTRRAPIVWSDSSDEDGEFVDAGRIMDPEDEDFAPEPSQPKKAASSTKPRNGKLVVSGKSNRGASKKEEKEFAIRDERKLPAPTASMSKEKQPLPSTSNKRPAPKEEDHAVPATLDASEKAQPESSITAEDPVPPPPKKRKLPPIKKNKTTTPSTPSTARPAAPAAKKEPPAPPPPATPSTDTSVRKVAATANHADFDLRDKSVYAQLFSKPAGSTPNAGLNRKEKEEERRRELNKMREEARAKRATEAKRAFDLQAAQEKISKVEERFRARKSMAAFPNVLGGYFKAIYDREHGKER